MSQQPLIWLDGSPANALPLPDRGLDFGDGLFETLLVHRGKPLFADLHMQRLAQGLDALSLPDCRQAAQEQMTQAANVIAPQWHWAVLRLSVTRSAGLRGYAPAANAGVRILISVNSIDRDCARMSAPATLCEARIRLSSQPLLARIKHMNRLEQVLAAAQAQAESVDECILYDRAGQLVSVIAGNLFLVCGGELLTPELLECGVAGTRRRLIIEKWAPAIGLKVRESRLTASDLAQAEEIFYSNSLHTVRPIARLANQHWDNHRICEALFKHYLEELT